MFCPTCGAPNADTASRCGSCGGQISPEGPGPVMAAAPSRGPVPTPPVSNHLVLSILSAAFCCLPLGIVAVVYSSQVNTKAALGDLPGALHASKRAQQWAIAGILSLPLVYVLIFGFAAVAAALEGNL